MTTDPVLLIVNMQVGFMNEATEYLNDRIGDLICEKRLSYLRATKFVNQPYCGGFSKVLGMQVMGRNDPETILTPEIRDQVNEKEILLTQSFDLPRRFLTELYEQSAREVCLVGIGSESFITRFAHDIFTIGYRPIVLADYCASTYGQEVHDSALVALERAIGTDQVVRGRGY